MANDPGEGTMKLPRRKFLHLAAGAAALPAVLRVARAQAYPSRPVRIVVPTPPGGPNDIIARMVGQWMSERFGQPFVIDNRPGGGNSIGTEVVVRASADGYTLLLCSISNAINAAVYDKLNYNFIRDIAPVAGVVDSPTMLVLNPSVPAKTLLEFIAHAKAYPDKLNMASAGIGHVTHLFGELFKMMTGTNIVHVPYRGAAPALTDMLSGQVQVMFTAGAIEHIKAGKLRALAITSAKRSEALPDLPAVGEFVPGYEASSWWGIGAPRNTPADIIDKLNKEVNAALADPRIKSRLADLVGVPMPMTPAELGKLIANDTEKWGKVVRTANIKVE
jgi:tripartite-type tricarboxylate transporter receptor subunit TctC